MSTKWYCASTIHPSGNHSKQKDAGICTTDCQGRNWYCWLPSDSWRQAWAQCVPRSIADLASFSGKKQTYRQWMGGGVKNRSAGEMWSAPLKCLAWCGGATVCPLSKPPFMSLNPQSQLQKNGCSCRTMHFPTEKSNFLQKHASPAENAHFPAETCGFLGAHDRKLQEIAGGGFQGLRSKNASQQSQKLLRGSSGPPQRSQHAIADGGTQALTTSCSACGQWQEGSKTYYRAGPPKPFLKACGVHMLVQAKKRKYFISCKSIVIERRKVSLGEP